MASASKVCRVCGKEYEACRSANRNAGVFRWQEVACSPECGTAYLEKINESRNLAAAPKRTARKKEPLQYMAESVAETVLEAVTVEPAVETVEPESDTSAEDE